MISSKANAPSVSASPVVFINIFQCLAHGKNLCHGVRFKTKPMTRHQLSSLILSSLRAVQMIASLPFTMVESSLLII